MRHYERVIRGPYASIEPSLEGAINFSMLMVLNIAKGGMPGGGGPYGL